MKMQADKRLLTIMLLLWSVFLFSQKLKYDVYLMGDKIGETVIERKDSAGFKLYSLRSKTDAKVLFIEKKSNMSTDVLYDKSGQIISSFFQNIKNEEKFLTKVFWDNNKLTVDKDGQKFVLPTVISFSSLLLYFTEPQNLQKVFSERLGKFFEMVKQTDGTYLASLDGHSAVYTYKAGKLVALEMKGSLGSVVMKLVQ